jgi:hypothetical protein
LGRRGKGNQGVAEEGFAKEARKAQEQQMKYGSGYKSDSGSHAMSRLGHNGGKGGAKCGGKKAKPKKGR